MTAALLEVRDLHAGYGRVAVLDGVSLEVPERGLVALVGSNGAGKSTLLRALSGLLRGTTGTIIFGGETLNGAAPAAIVRRGLLHVAEGRRLFRAQSVRDNLALGLWGTRLSKADAAERFVCFLDGAEGLAALRQVGPDADAAPIHPFDLGGDAGRAQTFAELGRAIEVDVDDRDVGAERREPQCIGAAQAARAAGHDGGLAVKLHAGLLEE